MIHLKWFELKVGVILQVDVKAAQAHRHLHSLCVCVLLAAIFRRRV